MGRERILEKKRVSGREREGESADERETSRKWSTDQRAGLATGKDNKNYHRKKETKAKGGKKPNQE